MLTWFGLQRDLSKVEDKQRQYWAGYALTSMVDIIQSSYLPEIRSAQQAELIVLSQDCQLASNQIANIYTDSSYAFSVAQNSGML